MNRNEKTSKKHVRLLILNQDAGNSIELASLYAQNGPNYADQTLATLKKGINRIGKFY